MLKALYTFQKGTANGLSVDFTDRSNGVIATRAWEFPTGTPSTSTATNPSTVFDSAGVKRVKLTVTQASPAATSEFIQDLLILEDGRVTLSVYQLIKNQFPPEFSFNEALVFQLVRYWQDYLRDLLNPVIAEVDAYNEAKWPILVNSLISKLVILNLVADGAKQSAIKNQGSLKRIETGPSNAEWHDSARYFTALFRDGGYEIFMADTCGLAKKLKLRLSICPKVNKSVLFSVYKPNRC